MDYLRRSLATLVRFVGGLLLASVLVAQQPKWTADGQRWTLRTDRADIAYIVKDGTGFWGFDVSFNRPRLICFAATLTEAERRVEKWEKR
jgi:hypothetical protein